DRRLRVRLSADYERLEFLRVLRSHRAEVINDTGGLIVPSQQVQPPVPLTDATPEETGLAAGGDDG
ncbi:MAG: rod shape-determining protein MreC, partial [Paracoccaceae bacterium]